MTQRFLTGATGFVGAALCAEIWRRDQAGAWLLLVRAADEARARTRVEVALRPHLGAGIALRASKTFAVAAGDLLDPHWRGDPRLAGVEDVLHAAANTSFLANKAVWDANLNGTLAIADAARRMPRLKRFLYAGTAFRCGAHPKDAYLEEGAPPGPDEAHFVEYTRSKAAAERVLLDRFCDLPMTVALPSIVAGHSELGCATGSSIFWFFRVLDLIRLVPCELHASIDVVPVDWTARALLHLLDGPSPMHRTYHVSAGACSRISLGDMAQRFRELKHGPVGEWQAFDMTSGWPAARHAFWQLFPERDAVNAAMLRGVRKYCQFVAQGLVFSNERLLGQGMSPPPPLTSYMAACLAHPRASVRTMFLDDAGSFGLRLPQ
jgi:nucleoside-diphosphate-sugar epimerase